LYFDEPGPGAGLRRRVDRVLVLAAALAPAVWLGASGVSAGAPASAAASAARVSVSINRSGIVFAPNAVPTGVVVFTVFNRTGGARDFGIGARRTQAIAVGRSATLTVALARRASRTFSAQVREQRPRTTRRFDA
jgi:hypothetical protein